MESGDERAPLLLTRTILQPSTQHTLACAAVIAANLLERLAYYSIAGNLVFFLYGEPLCWAISLATVTILVLTAITYYLGLLSGWISDSYFGRYGTIVVGYIIYIFGYIVFIYVSFYFEKFEIHDFQNVTYEGTSCNSTWQKDTRPPVCADGNSPNCLTALYVGVILVAIGAGTVRTNLASFGGDQARSGGIKSTHRFFTGYYWSLNLGAILALVAVAYIEDFNFFYGFIVAGSSLLLSFLLFLLGTKLYIRRPAGAINVFKIVYRVISNACYVKRNSNIQDDGTVHNFLDYANMEHEGGKFNVNQIEDVRRLWKLCKVFLLTIPYWMCYSQMVFNLFLLQGLHLHVRFDHFNECLSNNISDEIKSKGASANLCDHLPFIDYTDKKGTPPIPPASLAAFNAIFIVLFFPLIQKCYRFLSKKGIEALTWRRLWLGMLLASLALSAAGLLEYFRRKNIAECGLLRQVIGNTYYDASPGISLLWQIPQYCLVGASEVFFVVTGIEYAYIESPINMQGVVMGLFWLASGIGNFIGLALPYIFYYIDDIWQPKEYINCSRIDKYFFILAIFMLIYSFIFICISKCCDLSLNSVIVETHQKRNNSEPESASATPQLARRRTVRPVNFESSVD